MLRIYRPQRFQKKWHCKFYYDGVHGSIKIIFLVFNLGSIPQFRARASEDRSKLEFLEYKFYPYNYIHPNFLENFKNIGVEI